MKRGNQGQRNDTKSKEAHRIAGIRLRVGSDQVRDGLNCALVEKGGDDFFRQMANRGTAVRLRWVRTFGAQVNEPRRSEGAKGVAA